MKHKIAIVASIPTVFDVFLSDQITSLSKTYEIYLITNVGNGQETSLSALVNVKVVNVPIFREINIFSDIKTLTLLIKIFFRLKPTIVHSITPKAGILSMFASFLIRTPIRIHTFTGQVWATKTGLFRSLLMRIDRIINLLATIVLIDSFSQQKFLIENKVTNKADSKVLGHGSISGVDLSRFKFSDLAKKNIRLNLHCPSNAVVFLFVGRLKLEKGVIELIEAFSIVRKHNKNCFLWLVGKNEDQLSFSRSKMAGVSVIPFSDCPEKYMSGSDVLCLPSYREGFGTVVIEAGACGIPTIGSDIYGLSDAIDNGVTGLLIPPRSVNDLARVMALLAYDSRFRKKLGVAAFNRSTNLFSQDVLTNELVGLYNNLLKNSE